MSLLILIAVLLVVAELVYFRIADRCNIIDRPNERSSHSKVVLRGGGVIFVVGALLWFGVMCMLAYVGVPHWLMGGLTVGELDYVGIVGRSWPFVLGLLVVAMVSFIDDVHSLPDSARLLAQFVAMGLMFWSLGILKLELWWMVLIALVVSVGIVNVYNFMDGINGITGGYSLVALVPLMLICDVSSLALVMILAVLAFCFFNFRPKNKARCFAGDVGSVSMAFVLLYLLGGVIVRTGDVTYLVLLVVYGVDACLTIVHRIMLRENLGQAHRKHAYQIMANELGMSHVAVSLIYMGLQMAITAVYLWVLPQTALAHWLYLGGVVVVLACGYLLFMNKFYHLHARGLGNAD